MDWLSMLVNDGHLKKLEGARCQTLYDRQIQNLEASDLLFCIMSSLYTLNTRIAHFQICVVFLQHLIWISLFFTMENPPTFFAVATIFKKLSTFLDDFS